MRHLSYLEYLKKHTTVVADTGDIRAIEQYKPIDSTTNPSLILAVVKQAEYEPFIRQALKHNRSEEAVQILLVAFGEKILSVIPGRVSIEVDARLSYDTDATVQYAQHIIALFAKKGIERSRLLIKIAATWEGIEAAKQLENQGIHCNLTLLFSFAQAAACAEAGVTLISPFVGRILDWYKVNRQFNSSDPKQDPGVKFVTGVYHYFKTYGYSTEIMGASFRHIGEVMELVGCDLLTISPALLSELSEKTLIEENMEVKLNSSNAPDWVPDRKIFTKKSFLVQHHQDLMASDKLTEGIEKFCQDTVELENIITDLR